MSQAPMPGGRPDGLWRLQRRDRWAALRLLRRSVEHNAYLLSQIARGAIGRDDVAGPLVGHWRDGRLDGLCILGSNLVISRPASDEAVDAFAEYARRSRFRVWVAVGDDATIDRFMSAYGRTWRPIRIERAGQALYRVDGDALEGDDAARSPELRPADIREVEALMEADRAMVREELGFDPFVRDLPSYREGWRRRIREERCWVVGPVGGPVRFKVDHSAVSEDVVQLAGIFTRPEERRQGLARAGVGEMCRRLLGRVSSVTLYVHRHNIPAIALYESLGFERVGAVRSVWFEI
ncbi:MAG: GNAT family N-acetyltransferase [Myxococcota bacterium]